MAFSYKGKKGTLNYTKLYLYKQYHGSHEDNLDEDYSAYQRKSKKDKFLKLEDRVFDWEWELANIDPEYDYDGLINEVQHKIDETTAALEKFVTSEESTKEHARKVAESFEEEMTDEQYEKFKMKQFEIKHFDKFYLVLKEIKDYVPMMIEGRTEFLKTMGLTMNQRLIDLDVKLARITVEDS